MFRSLFISATRRVDKRFLYTVVAPPLPESITVEYVAKWYIFPNQKVSKNQGLFILETEKATIDICSPINGSVKEHLVELNKELVPGTPIMTIEDDNKGNKESKLLDIKFSNEFIANIYDKKLHMVSKN